MPSENTFKRKLTSQIVQNKRLRREIDNISRQKEALTTQHDNCINIYTVRVKELKFSLQDVTKELSYYKKIKKKNDIYIEELDKEITKLNSEKKCLMFYMILLVFAFMLVIMYLFNEYDNIMELYSEYSTEIHYENLMNLLSNYTF